MFTTVECRAIVHKVQKIPKLSAPKILSEMSKHTGRTCSPKTIGRVLHNDGYHRQNVRENHMLVITYIIAKKTPNICKGS